MYPSEGQLRIRCDFVKAKLTNLCHVMTEFAVNACKCIEFYNMALGGGMGSSGGTRRRSIESPSQALATSNNPRTSIRRSRPSTRILEIPAPLGVRGTSMFRITTMEGRQVPAFAITSSTATSMRKFYLADSVWDAVADLSRARLKPLLDEILDYNQRIGDILHIKPINQSSQDYLDWQGRIEALRLQRWKKVDERRALLAFRQTWLAHKVDVHSIDMSLRDKMRRSGMIEQFPNMSQEDRLRACVEQTIEDEEALPWECSDSEQAPTSTAHTLTTMASGSAPEILKSNLSKARKRLNQRDDDPVGRISRLQIERKVDQLRRDGLVYPPSTIVDQYGVTKMTAWNQQMDRNKRRYKSLKRRMRQKNVLIDRELSDDTEFSWDVEEDFLPSEPSSSSQRKRRRKSRRWRKKLPLESQSISEEGSQNASANHPLSHLSSLRIGSNLSKYPNLNRKYLKRQNMWAKYERDRTREKLNGRSRVVEAPKRMRAMQRRLAGYAAQMPNQFRLTNGARRHVGSREGRNGRDSSQASSHGNFEFWDRPEDPPEAEGDRASSRSQKRRGSVGSTTGHASKRVKT